MTTAPEASVAQIRKGVVELAVLGMLADGPRYGQQLVDDLAAHPALALTAGTVYPLLARLKKDGRIDSTWVESPVGPNRKYYRLTEAGTAAMSAMTRAWGQVKQSLDTILESR